MAGHGEECVAHAGQVIAGHATPNVAGEVGFKLEARAVAPGAEVTLHFAAPIVSTSSDRAWVTFVHPDQGPDAWGQFEYVPDTATTFSMKAPAEPGAYEARLHTHYPKLATNLVHTEGFRVEEHQLASATDGGETPRVQQRFAAVRTVLPHGSQAELRFPAPLHAKHGEQFWVTVVEAGAPDEKYGTWSYVPDGATTISLQLSDQPGEYELRLHANYPTKSTHVVHRVALHVQ
jgi:hypothetical protein